MTKTQNEIKQHKILQKQITKAGKRTEKEAQHQSIITPKQNGGKGRRKEAKTVRNRDILSRKNL